MNLIWNPAIGMYATPNGDALYDSPQQQAQGLYPTMIFYGGDYIQVFSSVYAIPNLWKGRKLVIPRANLTPAQANAKAIQKVNGTFTTSAQVPQALPIIAWVIILIVAVIIAVALAYGLYNFLSGGAGAPNTYYCTPEPPPAGFTGTYIVNCGGIEDDGGGGGFLEQAGNIALIAVGAVVIMGVVYVGYKLYTSRKRPAKEVMGEIAQMPGYAARGVYRGFVPAKPQPAAAAPPIQSPAGGYQVREAAPA